MRYPRLEVLVVTRDGRRLGFHSDLPDRQVPVVAGLMRQMADALEADLGKLDDDPQPSPTTVATGR